MKIVFLTSAVYPSATANRIHILAMADAFSKKGCSIDLLCREIKGRSFSGDVVLHPLGTKKSVSSAWKYAKFLKDKVYDFWFAREPHLLLLTIIFYIFIARKLPPKIVYEVHDMPRDFFDGVTLWVLRALNEYVVITITNSLAEDLIKKYHVSKTKILNLPDGVDIDKFSNVTSRQEAQRRLLYQDGKTLVVYSGSLFRWKGVYLLVDAARLTPDINYWFLGGYDVDIASLKEYSSNESNVRVLGHVTHDDIPMYLAAADVLVLPNSGTYKMSEKYTSPLKMFEYMAVRRPIVASDLSSIREILKNGVNSYLVKPDDAAALAEGIIKASSDLNKDQVVEQAYKDVQNFSWNARVGKIIRAVDI